MFRSMFLAALFAAVACASQEERIDVSAADKVAADMAGEAAGSTHKSAGGALDSASEATTLGDRPTVADLVPKAVNNGRGQPGEIGALGGQTQP